MAFRLVHLYAHQDIKSERLEAIQSMEGVRKWNIKKAKDGIQYSFLVQASKTQNLTDKLQPLLTRDDSAQIVIVPVVATIPEMEDDDDEAAGKKALRISREELVTDIAKSAEMDLTFFLLVFLSTIVAAIGLLENNVAVVIGAMVIAPLLGPNLAFSLATVLGDTDLMKQSAKTNFLGLAITLVISIFIGLFWTGPLEGSTEFMLRTDVGFSGIVLAIASGGAAVLSMVSGVSSVLVGVMVAVALLPPAVVLGLSFGAGETSYAFGALLLLSANIICINLSAIWVFIWKGVKPRTWRDKKQAENLSNRTLTLWLTALGLIILTLIIKSYWG